MKKLILLTCILLIKAQLGLAEDSVSGTNTTTTTTDSSSTTTTAPTKLDVETGNLTDSQKQTMENFVHTGYQQREYEETLSEECEKNGYSETQCKSIANGGNASSQGKFMGMSPTMIKGIAQAYTMFMGMSGVSSKLVANEGGVSTACNVSDSMCSDKGKTTKDALTEKKTANDAYAKNPEGEGLKDASDKADKKYEGTQEKGSEKKEQEDYCRYIPVGTEAMALIQQKSETEFIEQTATTSTENAQSAALEKQSRAHGARARTVNTQVMGWAATSACYVAMMAGPASVTAPSNLLKLGASTLLWRYFTWEKGEHQKAKSTVDAIRAKLSGKGTCNPISERDCYCAQAETENDVTYCLPQIRARVGGSSDYQLTCITDELKTDEQCQCRYSGTCLDKTITEGLEGIHIPQPAQMAISNFKSMAKGSLKPGQNQYDVNSNSNKLFAVANDMVKKNLDASELNLKPLSNDDKLGVNELTNFGIPKALAQALLDKKETDETKKNAAKLTSGSFGKYAYSPSKYSNKSNGTIRFSGGEGLKNKNSNNNNGSDFANMLNKMKKKTNANESGSANVIKFAESASRSAQITKDKSRMLFDIISLRYQVSGRKRLDINE